MAVPKLVPGNRAQRIEIIESIAGNEELMTENDSPKESEKEKENYEQRWSYWFPNVELTSHFVECVQRSPGNLTDTHFISSPLGTTVTTRPRCYARTVSSTVAVSEPLTANQQTSLLTISKIIR